LCHSPFSLEANDNPELPPQHLATTRLRRLLRRCSGGSVGADVDEDAAEAAVDGAPAW
jgi:hypothetical protein